MIIIHVTTYIFVLLLSLLNSLLLKFGSYIIIIRPYYGMAQSSSSVHILFPLSYFSSSFQYEVHLVPDEYPFVDFPFHVLRGN